MRKFIFSQDQKSSADFIAGIGRMERRLKESAEPLRLELDFCESQILESDSDPSKSKPGCCYDLGSNVPKSYRDAARGNQGLPTLVSSCILLSSSQLTFLFLEK